MKTAGMAWWVGGAAALLVSAAGCGGITASLGDGDGGSDARSGSGSGGGSTSGSGGGSTSSGSGGSSSGSGGSGSSGSGSGGSSTSGSGGGSGSGSGGSTSSSSGSGGSSGSGSGGSSSSSSGGGPSGTIYFEQCTGSVLCATSQFSFYAGFFPSTATQGCTVVQSGSCSSYSCTGTTTTPMGVSAGTLTISGGSIGTVTVAPDATNTYTYQSSGTKFAAGQTLVVSASGATVPAFGPDSVVAPGLPSLVTPTPAGTTYTIPTTGDLPVAWSGGSPGGTLIFEGTGTSGGTSYFTCEWPASQGKAVVPHAVLAPLAGQTGGYLIYGQYAATTFDSGGYTISEAALPFTGAAATFK